MNTYYCFSEQSQEKKKEKSANDVVEDAIHLAPRLPLSKNRG